VSQGATPLVKGTAVVDLADGKKLGTIDHVYLDPEKKRIIGFSFHSGGLFGKTSGVVDMADVHGIGPDAVTIDDASAIRSGVVIEARTSPLVDLDDLLKRKVITENGTFVGRVASIRFGEASHGLVAIEVAPEGDAEHRLIPADRIQQLGGELVVIAETAVRASAQRLVRVA
jgi:sporulation protein YlmC with PRC-barrel domain